MSPLTPRELEIVSITAAGLNDKDIALVLGVTTYTVKDHQKHIREKLNCENRISVVTRCLRGGWVK